MILNTVPSKLMAEMVDEDGRNLTELAGSRPVLLIFLRHFGCTFCRQALKDLSEIQDEIKDQGIQLAFVHLAEEDTAQYYFKKNGLEHLPRISDPEGNFYQQFGLVKGTFKQLLGLQVWIKGFQSAVVERNALSVPVGDGFQMPGIFILEGNRIVESFIHKYASDRPDYLSLISCCNRSKVRS